MIGQLRKSELQLFPNLGAPSLSPIGGRVAPSTPVSVNSAATVYLMPDGSDPRALGGGIRPGAISVPPSMVPPESPVPFGSIWRFLDTGTDLGTAWRSPAFDDSTWSQGAGELGFGDSDENTTIQGGPPDTRHATAYFRRAFTVTDTSGIESATLSIRHDDEAWVYLNGQLLHKTASSLPDNPRFDAYTGTTHENATSTLTVDPSLLLEGSNLFAVEVHQGNATSSDLSFDLQLQILRTTPTSPAASILTQSAPGIQTLRLRARDDASSEWSPLVEATFAVGTDSPAPGSLAFAEVLYAPAPPSDAEKNAGFRQNSEFEFILIQNVSSAHLDLAGVRLDKAVSFTFTESSPHRVLAPGGLLVVAANPEAFRMRHGNTLAVVGPFTGILSNEGDEIRLLSSSVTIAELSYTSGGPWPLIPPGSGYSLVRDQPGPQPGSGNTPGEWYVSYRKGGDFQQSPPAQGSIQFAATVHTATESQSAFGLPIFRTGPLTTPASAQFSTLAGSASAGSDFTATSGSLTFPVGSASVTLPVHLLEDSTAEPSESFTITLSAPTGALLGSISSTQVQIEDNDSGVAPSNDAFARALPISGASGSLTTSNLSATREPGEPTHAAPGSASIWFRWTAPATGFFQFTTVGSSAPDGSLLNTLLAAYSGNRLSSLTCLASNDDSGAPTSSVSFSAVKGLDYFLAVDGAFGAAGSILLQWNPADALLQFSSPTFRAKEGQPTALLEVVRSGNTASAASVGFSTSPGSASPDNDFSSATGTVSFAPGQRSALLQIPLIDDSANEGPESFGVSLQSPSTGHSLGSSRSATVLLADDEDEPLHNAFSVPSILPGDSGSLTTDNSGADLERGEPSAGTGADRSVWFNWTAPRNGRAMFETVGSLTPGGAPLDTLLAVYTGSELGSLQMVASNDNTPLTLASRVEFTAQSGRTYRIAATDRSGGGTLLLTWSLVDSDTLLEPVPGLPAPFLEVTESYSESLAGSLATGFTIQPRQNLAATLKAPLRELRPELLTPSSPFEIRLGSIQFSGALGMDPSFAAGKTSAKIPLSFNSQPAGTLQLSWNARQLILSLSVSHPDLLFEAGEHLGSNGPFTGQVGASQVYFSISHFTASRRLYFSGSASTSNQIRGGMTLTLRSASLRASSDLSGPAILIQKPLPPTKTSAPTVSLAGSVSDLRTVASAQLWINGAPLPSLLLSNSLPAPSATFSATAVPLLPGQNSLEIRATDRDGNLSVSPLTVTRSVQTPITLTIQGAGSISGKPNGSLLDIQSSSTWTAKPAPGWIFERWSGSTESDSPSLTANITENFLLQASFIRNPFLADTGTFRGLIRSSAASPEGWLATSLSASGALTGKLHYGTAVLSFKAQLRPDGSVSIRLPRPGLSPLTLFLGFTLQGTGQLTGTLTDSSTILQIDAEQDAAFTSPVDCAGSYSIVFQPGTPAFPGHGYAAASVTARGALTLAGSLPDGTKFSAGSPLPRTLLFTFLSPLSQPSSQLIGFLSLQAPFTSRMIWSRSAFAGLPAIAADFNPAIRLYRPPATNARILASLDDSEGAGLLTFTSTSLGSHSRIFISDSKNKAAFPPVVPARSISLSFNPASGIFLGTFQDPGSGGSHSFSGIVDQSAGRGAGFFLGPQGPGALTLSPAAD